MVHHHDIKVTQFSSFDLCEITLTIIKDIAVNNTCMSFEAALKKSSNK